MKVNPHVAVANVIGFGLVGTAFLLERSSCLSLPSWATPVLMTLQIALNAVSPALVSKAPAPPQV